MLHAFRNVADALQALESDAEAVASQRRVERIAALDGGTGQNGNGINVFRAGEVIVDNNHISGCAFSAVRLNATTNTQVTGNACIDSGETAIFSEFGFSGSVIANNVIDRAALGISIANLDSEGHLATCSGNIVRNILPSSPNNPDTTPCGIFAEADVAPAVFEALKADMLAGLAETLSLEATTSLWIREEERDRPAAEPVDWYLGLAEDGRGAAPARGFVESIEWRPPAALAAEPARMPPEPAAAPAPAEPEEHGEDSAADQLRRINWSLKQLLLLLAFLLLIIAVK